MDWVNFDQINSGAKGEENHQEYKEEDGSHCEHVLDYYLFMVC